MTDHTNSAVSGLMTPDARQASSTPTRRSSCGPSRGSWPPPQLPCQPGLDGAEAHVRAGGPPRTWSSSHSSRLVGCERQVVLGFRHDALHHGAQVLPAEGRQRSGSPVERSQTTVARPLVRDAPPRGCGSATFRRATSWHTSRDDVVPGGDGIELDEIRGAARRRRNRPSGRAPTILQPSSSTTAAPDGG